MRKSGIDLTSSLPLHCLFSSFPSRSVCNGAAVPVVALTKINIVHVLSSLTSSGPVSSDNIVCEEVNRNAYVAQFADSIKRRLCELFNPTGRDDFIMEHSQS